MASKYTLMNYAPEMYEKDKMLVDSIHSRVPSFGRMRIDNAFELAKIFREYGYKGLRVGPNKSSLNKPSNAFVSLDKLVNINPNRIIAVAQDMYFNANKRINSFGDPSKNPNSPFYKKIPPLDDLIEEDGQFRLF